MADESGDGGADVSYPSLLTDPALLAVFLISSTAAVGINAVPVALPRIATTFAVSEARIGLVMSAFTLPVIVLLPITGVLADIYGRRAVVLPSLFLLGLTGVATVLVTNFQALLVLRGLQGVAFAGTLPLSATLTGDLYTGPEGSAAQGIRSGLNGLASAVAPVVAAALAAMAWQYPFLIFALAFPVMGVVYRYYPDPVERPDGGASAAALVAEFRTYWRAVRGEVVDRALALLLAGGFALFFVKQAVRTFVPVFVVGSLGMPIASVGVVLGVYGTVRVLVSPLAGAVVARAGRRRTMLGALAVGAVGIAAIPFAADTLRLSAAVGVYAVGEATLNPVLNDAVAAFAADERRAGIMSSLQILKNAALTLAPALLGSIIAVAGFEGAFLFAAGIVTAYAVGVGLFFRPDSGTFT